MEKYLNDFVFKDFSSRKSFVKKLIKIPNVLEILSISTPNIKLYELNDVELLDKIIKQYEKYRFKNLQYEIHEYFVDLGLDPWQESILKKLCKITDNFDEYIGEFTHNQVDRILEYIQNPDNILDIYCAGMHRYDKEFEAYAGIIYADSFGKNLYKYLKDNYDVDKNMYLDYNSLKENQLKELEILEKKNIVIRYKNCIYLRNHFYFEKESAKILAQFAKKNCKFHDSFNDEKLDPKLDEKQKDAISSIYNYSILLIVGGPGTGKSCIIGEFAKSYEDPNELLFLAPTGKAVNNIRSYIDCADIKTDQFLTISKSISRKIQDDDLYPHPTNLFENKSIIIIDESSMISQKLLWQLLKEIIMHNNIKRIVFLGDNAQLPSIEAGCPFLQLVESNIIKTVALKKVYRQKGNDLPNVCKKIRKGEIPEFSSSFIIKPYSTEIVKELALEDPNTLFMSFQNCDVEKNQEIIRNTLNTSNASIEFSSFKIGDKVIYIKNNYQKNLFNGMSGIIIDYTKGDQDKEPKFEINFEGKTVLIRLEEMNENIQLAYIITVHKAQGSQSNNCVIILGSLKTSCWARDSIYTAITRSKKKVIILGPNYIVNNLIKKDE
jgi:exodeoxyribonuclease V alpha subunit